MDPQFWHSKWQSNEIGFHMNEANPMLLAHFQRLQLQPGQRVFVPLCGKTLDIAWLLDQGFRVVGVELSILAIDQLFAELGVAPEVTEYEELIHYRAPNLDVFIGDLFLVSAALLGEVDAVYDRAALVALPADMRAEYTRHVVSITAAAPQLLITFDYDQSLLPGPPFCVNEAEVRRHYESSYKIQLLESTAVAGNLKGVCPALELVMLLQPPGA
ncbi:MAG: thiopurine S-methyltransferase [Pseudomonadales bacterium]|nr:thiopurine S-methyltransferase [Pseudomonadales bacterium]RLT99927.1 MAG: thiopurine S-methyltransferase [Ketobacter sp.]